MVNIKKFEKNILGVDYVIGDIHGMWDDVEKLLKKVGFNEKTDRLFSVGDLVDRGPRSADVLHWLDKPWFHAVMGNHEDMFLQYRQDPFHTLLSYGMSGGFWVEMVDEATLNCIEYELKCLPQVIIVDTDNGPVCIAHADLPYKCIDDLYDLEDKFYADTQNILWNRTRFKCMEENRYCKLPFVSDAYRVFVGHSVVEEPVLYGNVHYIDTGGCFQDGYLTIIPFSGTPAIIVPEEQSIILEV